MDNKEAITQWVYQSCKEDPSLVKHIIDAATEGVKAFADKQSDKSTKLAFMMTQVLESCPNDNFASFSRKDIVEYIEPWFEGTPWMREQKEKLIKQ